MYRRNKVLAIESIVVMFVLILLAFVVFLVIRSGAGAYENIIEGKQTSEGARVAYSYINMKIKQNDVSGRISVVDTQYGGTLKLDTSQDFSTYIFFCGGYLYECVTRKDDMPNADAANIITSLSGFEVKAGGSYIDVVCQSGQGESIKIFHGTVGLRT